MSYVFDPTGKSVHNLVIGESKPIALAPGRNRLYIVPNNGPFFLSSLVIKHTTVNGAERYLTEGVDYRGSFQFTDATRKLNAPVCAGITFLNLLITGTVTYNYQALGSLYSASPATILNLETVSTADPMFTTWDTVATPPEVPATDFVWNTINIDTVQKTVQELSKLGLVVHLRPRLLNEPNDPAFIPTAEEIGLGDVPNYPVATVQQAVPGLRNDLLMTPLTTAAVVEAEVTKQLAEIGYLVPVPYTGGIFIDNEKFTVNVQGEVYIIKPSSLPHTTSGVWATDSTHFELFEYARKENWVKTYITVAGTEPTVPGLGYVFNVNVEQDSRLAPQLILNDMLILVYGADYKLSDNKLYVRHPIVAGDKLILLTKRSMLSMAREETVNKAFVVTNNTTVFDISDIKVDKENLRVILNEMIILNEQAGDYSINNGLLSVTYDLGIGDVIEVENIDSTFVFGKSTLRGLLSMNDNDSGSVSAELASPAGEYLIGSSDNAGGTLWSNIGGFVQYILSNLGASKVGSTPTGDITAMNVQVAINQLESQKTSKTALAANTGAALVGSNDGVGGSLWTTVAGFIQYVRNAMVTLTGTQTLSNKTISFDNNTLTNVVGITTNQSISGIKTFTQPIVSSGEFLTNLNADNLTTGTVPTTRLPVSTTAASGVLKLSSVALAQAGEDNTTAMTPALTRGVVETSLEASSGPLQSINPSGMASVIFTDLILPRYILMVDGLDSVSSDDALVFQISSDNGVTWTSAYSSENVNWTVNGGLSGMFTFFTSPCIGQAVTGYRNVAASNKNGAKSLVPMGTGPTINAVRLIWGSIAGFRTMVGQKIELYRG